MSELFEKINENAAVAAEKEQAIEEEARRCHESYMADRKRQAQLKRKLANQKLIVRAVAAAVLCGLLWLAMGLGLIAPELAIPLQAVSLAWAMMHLGAWLQYIGRGLFV